MTFTTVQDLASIVAKAIEYEGKWPVVSGIQGNQHTLAEVIKLGEKIRGKYPLQEEKFDAISCELTIYSRQALRYRDSQP